jgi:hypothetical protein
MTNPLKGEVTFEARGQTFTFKLGTNAQIMLEAKTGVSIAEWYRERNNNLTVTDMRTLFHVALYRNHQMTEEDVGDLMDEIGTEKVGEIFKQSGEFAKRKINGEAGNDPHPQKPAKQRIGMNS